MTDQQPGLLYELNAKQRATVERARQTVEEATRALRATPPPEMQQLRTALEELNAARRALTGKQPSTPASPTVTREDFERLEQQVQRMQATIEALLEVVAKDDPDLRQRIAETHLMAGQMHRHFIPEPDEESSDGTPDETATA